MPKAPREVVLVPVAFALALVLLFLTGNVVRPEGWGAFEWGWPIPWHLTEDLMVGGVSALGFYLGTVVWMHLWEDLLFWVAVAISAVEATSRLGVPWVRRRLAGYDRRRATMKPRVQKETPNPEFITYPALKSQ